MGKFQSQTFNSFCLFSYPTINNKSFNPFVQFFRSNQLPYQPIPDSDDAENEQTSVSMQDNNLSDETWLLLKAVVKMLMTT